MRPALRWKRDRFSVVPSLSSEGMEGLCDDIFPLGKLVNTWSHGGPSGRREALEVVAFLGSGTSSV